MQTVFRPTYFMKQVHTNPTKYDINMFTFRRKPIKITISTVLNHILLFLFFNLLICGRSCILEVPVLYSMKFYMECSMKLP